MDDGSVDGTWNVLEQAAIENFNVSSSDSVVTLATRRRLQLGSILPMEMRLL